MPNLEISEEVLNDENLIGIFSKYSKKFKPVKVIDFPRRSYPHGLALIENNTKLLATDLYKFVLVLFDIEGNYLKSFNPHNLLDLPIGVCVLSKDLDEDSDSDEESNEEKIFVGDGANHKVFVFDLNFNLKYQFGDENMKVPYYMKIDNAYDKSRLYASDYENHEITVWNAKTGKFIDKTFIRAPMQICLTEDCLYVSNYLYQFEQYDNGVVKFNEAGNCITELNKETLGVLRRITGDWFAPNLLSVESNGNINIAACAFDNVSPSQMLSFFTIDPNGKVLKEVEMEMHRDEKEDIILVDNRIYGSIGRAFKMYEFE
jgi:hypothetical protein